ncbi:MAG: hypothetical protein JWN89_39 [Parcubacteria group bacterium]|nr:hypothetical protein [Parcubacteria group bacterium]
MKKTHSLYLLLLALALVVLFLAKFDIQAQIGWSWSVADYKTGLDKESVRLIQGPIIDGWYETYLWMSREQSGRLFGNDSEGLLKWESDPGSGYDSPGFRKVTDPKELELVRGYAQKMSEDDQKALFRAPDFGSGVVWKSDRHLI